MDDIGGDIIRMRRWAEVGRRLLAIDEAYFESALAAHESMVSTIKEITGKIVLSDTGS